MKDIFTIIGLLVVVGVTGYFVFSVPSQSVVKGPRMEQADQFVPEIEKYLSERSFGMKVVNLEELQVEPGGKTARGVCVLKDAEGAYNFGVRWNFKFEKDKKGKWKAVSHEIQ